MNKKIVIGLVVALVITGVYLLSGYNTLVVQEEKTITAWAQVETQYQRRYDLIPNLVASVQGVMKQETAVFTAIAEARKGYAGAVTQTQKVEATSQVEGALSRLLVVMENYPTLKSSEVVMTFMSQLEGTENRISVETGRYNEAVQAYNITLRTFPRNIIATLFHFETKKPFSSVNEARTAPKVDLTQ